MTRIFALLLCLFGAAHAANPGDLLEPEKAFRFSTRALDANMVEVSFAIAEGYYMYRERFKFAGDPGSKAKLGAPQFPAGIRKKDEFFGEVETYRKQVVIRLPVESADGSLQLTVTSQGCADAGVCYIPMESKATIRLAGFSTPAAGAPAAPDPGFSLQVSDFEVARLFEAGGPLLVLASFLGFGLLLAFTPCMLPMIPILSGIIAGEGRDLGKLRALLLSSAYVLGMAVAYAVAGVAAAWSGTLLASALQNAWVLGAFALIFVALALSMFGLYELQLPGFLHHRLHATHGRLQGGRVASVAAMGALSAVIVSPCVAAPLAGALLYISQTRDVALGGSALFAMALGMGIPLLVVGVSEGALLPKSGPWMLRVKQVFGVLLLAVALWIVWPLLRPSGGGAEFTRIHSLAELEQKLQSPGKPVMLDFYADWCVSCKEMEALTLSDSRVKPKLSGMLLLQADVTANSAEHKALLKRFHLFGPPGIIFFDAQGRELQGLRVIGYQNAERFLKTLDLAGRALMLEHVRGIDHAVILVRDLDRARDTYTRMGFTLTPRGFHSLGSQNHCVMFRRDYLELMALPAVPPAAFQYFADFLAQREGVGALALATDDAAGAHVEVVRAGIAAEAPLALSRPVADLGEARFTLVQLPPAETPGFRSFLCQHHTRDIVWRPEYQRHANGAGEIKSVTIASTDSARYARLLDGIPVKYARADVASIAAIRVQVDDKKAAADCLKRGGFSFVALKDGALVVPADEAHGVMLVFG